MKIKVCGITREEDFRLIADSGLIDYAGFIFCKESPRYISPERAKVISHSTDSRIKTVGVFVNTETEEIEDIASCVKLDIVQLHGDESPEYCNSLKLPYWKVIRPSSSADLFRIDLYSCSTILLDSYSKSAYGGTGRKLPGSFIEEALQFNRSIIVAGGINSTDLRLLKSSGLYASDLNSSLECSPGIKDHEKLIDLFNTVERINETN